MNDLLAIQEMYHQQDSGAELDVRHPITHQPIGLKVRVLGYSGERMRKYSHEATNERIRNPRRFRTAEALESQAHDQIAAAVVGWTWAEGVTLNGEQPEATPENVRRVMKALPFVADQIDTFAADLANFTVKAA